MRFRAALRIHCNTLPESAELSSRVHIQDYPSVTDLVAAPSFLTPIIDTRIHCTSTPARNCHRHRFIYLAFLPDATAWRLATT